MIIRIIAFLAGACILAASAYATVVHSNADFAQKIVIWASVAGLMAGAVAAAHVGGWYRAGVILFILAGELAGGWMTFERTVENREYRSELRQQRRDEIAGARARVEKAETKLSTAQKAVLDQSALRDCKANCRTLLQNAVDAADLDLKTARTALAALPAPFTDVKTGVDAWKVTLLVAIALVLSTNGMGAMLVGIAARPAAKPAVPAIVRDDDPQTDSPGPESGRTEKSKALSEVLGMLADGRTIPSQDYLAEHWDRPKQTVSDWMREWRRIGVIPSETRTGRCKATIPA